MSEMMVAGPCRTSGSIEVSGNKNGALPAIAAAMLTEEPVTLRNVPDIGDVHAMLAIIRSLGGQAEFSSGVVRLCGAGLRGGELPGHLCHAVRTSLLFAGPLARRLGRVTLGAPGGDVIGRRRLDTHLYGLHKLGIDFEAQASRYVFTRRASTPCELFLDEASVTATEHIMATAALTPGVTVIRNAACEPHVRQLGEMLAAMGAPVEGGGTNTVTVHGVRALSGCDLTLEGDYIEAASYLALCAATGGDITVTGHIVPSSYWMARRVFEKFGCPFTLTPGRIEMRAPERLRIAPDFNHAIPVIADGPWPQFPSDMMSCLVAMATQAEGTVLFFEKMFESRLHFVDKLVSMGASAVICDPHRVVISGPAALRGAELSSPDIRAGMALIIAACCASGTSVIHNMDMVRRGYPNLAGKLQALGMAVRLEE